MAPADLLFAVTVLETPLGPTLEHEDDSPVARERAGIIARYVELKRPLGVGAASRQARAEWLAAYLAGRGEACPTT